MDFFNSDEERDFEEFAFNFEEGDKGQFVVEKETKDQDPPSLTVQDTPKRKKQLTMDSFKKEQSDAVKIAIISAFNEKNALKYTTNLLDASTWTYPSNYQIRSYQQELVEKSLFDNTFVSLPTGLGKTFIAAVVMLNFHKWFPKGKMIFVAPSRPLVLQQIRACAEIVGFQPDLMADLTGSVNPTRREGLWQTRKVFFATAQTVMNDFATGKFKAEDLKVLVLDEAHHATKTHPYVRLIQDIVKDHPIRVLSLSATPGNSLKGIHDVLDVLQRPRLVVKTSEDPDVKKYSQSTKLDVIVVQNSKEIDHLLSLLNAITTPVHTRLKKVISYLPELSKCTPFGVLQLMQDQQQSRNPQVSMKQIMGDFGVLRALVEARKSLLRYGVESCQQTLQRNLVDFKQNKRPSQAKMQIIQSMEFKAFMEICEANSNSHPKLKKCVEILEDHFLKHTDSRVIVFSSLRNSVNEIYQATKGSSSIRASTFVGQGSDVSSKGISQKVQLDIVRKFRRGEINTLVATCIAEEGLDVGEVDLILCFDVKRSMINMTQRMGRTGRRRAGRCVLLMQRGKEEEDYQKSLSSASKVMRDMKGIALKSSIPTIGKNALPRELDTTIRLEHIQATKPLLEVERSSRKRKGSSIVLDEDECFEYLKFSLKEEEEKLLFDKMPALKQRMKDTSRFESPASIGAVNHSRSTRDAMRIVQCIQNVRCFGLKQAQSMIDEIEVSDEESIEFPDPFEL